MVISRLTTKQLFTSGIALGILLASSLSMFMQDWLGLEGYIEFCRNHWVNLHWAIGAIGVVISVKTISFLRKNI